MPFPGDLADHGEGEGAFALEDFGGAGGADETAAGPSRLGARAARRERRPGRAQSQSGEDRSHCSCPGGGGPVPIVRECADLTQSA